MRVQTGADFTNTNLGTVDHSPTVFCTSCDILPTDSYSQRKNTYYSAFIKQQ